MVFPLHINRQLTGTGTFTRPFLGFVSQIAHNCFVRDREASEKAQRNSDKIVWRAFNNLRRMLISPICERKWNGQQAKGSNLSWRFRKRYSPRRSSPAKTKATRTPSSAKKGMNSTVRKQISQNCFFNWWKPASIFARKQTL